MPRISQKEIDKATKLASRKSGVTREQLATTLGVQKPRAARILELAGLAGEPAGKGKENRTLVYRA